MKNKLDILVVDDWLDSAESLAELLQIWGFEARAANSGLAALEAARQKLPDVVVMDISMPRMNGIEAAGFLRREHPGHPMHLIAMTGHGRESACHAAIQAQFDTHLVKPADPQKIHAILRVLVQAWVED